MKKKIVVPFLIFFFSMSVVLLTYLFPKKEDISIQKLNIIVSEKELIQKYCEEYGEYYDSSLIEIHRVEEQWNPSYVDFSYGGKEYKVIDITDKKTTDFSRTIVEVDRPKGESILNEYINMGLQINKPKKCPLHILESIFMSSFKLRSWELSWEGKYEVPVSICVYPIIKEVSGTLLEDDCWKDDNLGTFSLRIPIGYELRVYQQ